MSCGGRALSWSLRMPEPAISTPVPFGPQAPRPPRRTLRWLGRLAMMLAGLALGTGIAEAMFRYRDDGAFPHLNVYVADPELGVRLLPGATEKVGFAGNPIT